MSRLWKAALLAGCTALLSVLVVGLALNDSFGTSTAADWAAAHPTTTPESQRINLNTATKEDLMRLPEMTHKLADRILAYRDGLVLIRDVDEIRSVRGVTDELYELWRPYLSV